MTDTAYQRLPIPPINKYWDAPPSKDQGDANAEIIYQSVGRALSTWERVETDFAMLFGFFVESRNNVAERVYGTIISNLGRRDALIEAAKIFLSNFRHAFPKNDFNLLINHFKNACARRNEIAHGMVMSFTLNEKTHGFFLAPPPYNSRKIEAKTFSWWQEVSKQSNTNPFHIFGLDYRYTSADIDHFAELFDELHKHVFALYGEQFNAKIKRQMEDVREIQQSPQPLGEPSPSKPQESE